MTHGDVENKRRAYVDALFHNVISYQHTVDEVPCVPNREAARRQFLTDIKIMKTAHVQRSSRASTTY